MSQFEQWWAANPGYHDSGAYADVRKNVAKAAWKAGGMLGAQQVLDAVQSTLAEIEVELENNA